MTSCRNGAVQIARSRSTPENIRMTALPSVWEWLGLNALGLTAPWGNRRVGGVGTTRYYNSTSKPHIGTVQHIVASQRPVQGQREHGPTGAPTKHPVLGDKSAPSCTFTAADVGQS